MNSADKTEMPLFTPACFWDVDYRELDIEKDKSYIICRVINGGLEKEDFKAFKNRNDLWL